MSSIYTNDGKYIRQVYSIQDALQEVEENHSTDLAIYIKDWKEDVECEKGYKIYKVEEELKSYEASLESAQRLLSDTTENLTYLLEKVENGKRLSRDSILSVLTSTVKEIQNVL
jgi:hypothetical protein